MDEPTQRRTTARGPRAFLDRLTEDPHAATDALLAAMSCGRLTPEEALLQVLAPAAVEAGERWARGDDEPGAAHLAAAAVEDAVAVITHAHVTREHGREQVVIAPADGDTHVLPSRLFGAALALRGWDVRLVASPLAGADLTALLADTRPRALLLTCTMPSRLAGAARSVAAAHEAGVSVVAGGAAFGTSPRRAAIVGADAWASSVDGVERILATPRAPHRTTRDVADALAEGDDALLAEAWTSALRLDLDAAPAEWLSRWVPLVLRSVRAAILADDDDVLVQDLCWLVRTTSGRFPAGELVPSMLSPLRRLVPPSDVRVHRLVAVAEERLEAARPRPAATTPSSPRPPRRAHPSTTHGREAFYDEIAFIASVTYGVDTAVVVLADGDRMAVKGAHGTTATAYDAGAAWAAAACVADARESGDLASHPLVARHGAAFVGQVPVHDAEGHPCGAVVVYATSPKDATWPQRQALRSLARQVEARLRTASAESAPLVIVDGEALDAAASPEPAGDELMRTSQVARLFSVSPRTVNNWVGQGRLPAITTAGGHKRYRADDVMALYREQCGAIDSTNTP